MASSAPPAAQTYGSDEGTRLWGVRVVTLCTVVASFAYTCIMLIALPLSINLIVTGGAAYATEESQMLYTLCFFLKQVSSFLFAAAVGEFGNVIGRKMTALAALLGYLAAAIVSLGAHLISTWALHIVAQILLGATSPLGPTGIAYITDCSTVGQLGKNTGVFQSCIWIGIFVGFMLAIATIIMLPADLAVTTQYLIGVVSLFAGSGFLMWKLPDISPAKYNRRTVVWRNTLPWQTFLAMRSRTTYTQLVFCQLIMSSIGLACVQSYLAYYLFVRYGVTPLGLAGLCLLTFVWQSLCSYVILRWLKLSAAVATGYISAILSGVAIMLLPSEHFAIWISVLLGGPSGCLIAAIPVMLCGQVPETERGELAGVAKGADAVGRMIGALVGGYFGALWIGSPKLQRDFPGLPCLSNVTFYILILIIFATNETRFKSQCMLSVADIKVKTKTGAVAKPSTDDGNAPAECL